MSKGSDYISTQTMRMDNREEPDEIQAITRRLELDVATRCCPKGYILKESVRGYLQGSHLVYTHTHTHTH